MAWSCCILNLNVGMLFEYGLPIINATESVHDLGAFRFPKLLFHRPHDKVELDFGFLQVKFRPESRELDATVFEKWMWKMTHNMPSRLSIMSSHDVKSRSSKSRSSRSKSCFSSSWYTSRVGGLKSGCSRSARVFKSLERFCMTLSNIKSSRKSQTYRKVIANFVCTVR